METLSLAFRLVMPMCMFMLIGYVLQRRKFFTPEALAGLNKMMFRLVIPCSVAKSIYTSSIKEGSNWNVLIFAGVATVTVNVVCAIVMPRIDRDKRRIPVMIQAVSKSNYVLVGLNMVSMMYGDDIGMAGVMVAVTAILNNVFSTIFFEYYRGGNVDVIAFIRKILTNPLVLSGIIGLMLNLSGIKLPSLIVNDVVGKLGNCGTPIALVMMGAGFSFEYVNRYKRLISIATIGRLIVVPMIEVPIAILLGFRTANLLALTVCAATPTAVNAYNTAVAMGGDGDLAGVIVAITSVCSVVTIFMWVSILSVLGVL